MQPADIAVALRRRSPWEAMDLGLSMLQRWWRAVYGPHLAVGGAIAAISLLAAWSVGQPWVAIVLVWWLKPLYDRVVLHVLSRAVFGELHGWRTVLAAWREWLGTGLIAALTYRRLEFARSFNLPVRQLEGQTRGAGRERRSVLGRRAYGYAVWLTLVCLAFQTVLYWSLNLLAQLFLPAKSTAGQLFGQHLFSSGAWSYGDVLAHAGAVLMLEPFYVAAGFALYLNRRTILEGWDIEVALRKIATRHAVPALLLIAFVCAAFPVDSHAQKVPKTEIAEVLKAPEFPHEREELRWSLRDPRQPSNLDLGDLGWLRAVGYAMAKAAEVAFWILAGAAVAYALWWASRMLPRRAAPRPEPYRPPSSLFGMELAPDTLPADVAAAAAALAREGRLREALSLLYRGALSELVHRRGIELLASHTEGEVLDLSPPQIHAYLQNLITVWRQCAYASRKPTPDDIERLAQGYQAMTA